MKLNKDIIRQRHLEKFEELYLNGTERTGVNVDRGAALRAAVEAGWFTDVPDGYDVGDEKPSLVREYYKQINELYLDVIKLDPNS